MSVFALDIGIAYSMDNNDNELSTNEKEFERLQDTIDYSANNQKITRYAQKYAELAERSNSQYHKAKAIYNKGVSYWLQVQYSDAVNLLYKSLQMAEEINDTLLQINSSIYLGLVYSRLDDWDLTKKYYKNAYKLSQNYEKLYYRASACWNMALISSINGKHKKAMDYSNEALQNLDKAKFENKYEKHFGYGLVYYYLSYAHYERYELDSALHYVKKAIAENKKIENNSILASCYNMLSDTYLAMKKYNKVIESSQKAHEFAQMNNDLSILHWSYGNIAKAYKQLKNLDSAYAYMKLHAEYLDTMNRKDARILSSKLELQKKEKDFLREKELADQKFSFLMIISIIIIIALILIALLIYSRFRLKSKLNIELEKLNLAKDKFFGIISHDLSGPVSSLNSTIKLLSENHKNLNESKLDKHLKRLYKSSNQTNSLLDNLLTWARLQKNDLTPDPYNINISELVKNEIANYEYKAKSKNINIKNNVSNGTVVYADKFMVSAIVRNLLSNSIKFSYSGNDISISEDETNGHVDIIIKDSGVGIEKNRQDKIFDIKTKNSSLGTEGEKGTGLGLHLCYEFAKKNNGKIYFESEKNKGTEFHVILEKSDEDYDEEN